MRVDLGLETGAIEYKHDALKDDDTYMWLQFAQRVHNDVFSTVHEFSF